VREVERFRKKILGIDGQRADFHWPQDISHTTTRDQTEDQPADVLLESNREKGDVGSRTRRDKELCCKGHLGTNRSNFGVSRPFIQL
jgi:hypothetical protein